MAWEEDQGGAGTAGTGVDNVHHIHDESGRPLGWSSPAPPPGVDGLPVSVGWKDENFEKPMNREDSTRAVRFKETELQQPKHGSGRLASYPSNGIEKLEDVSLGPGSDKPKSVLLYGMLELWLYEAKNLPNMDMFSERLNQCMSIVSACRPLCVKAKEKVEDHRHHRITSDPYVVLTLGDAVLAKTRVLTNSQDPAWNEHFVVHVAHFVTELVLTIKDNDVFGAQVIGTVKLPADKIASGAAEDGWFDILGSGGKIVKGGAQLKLFMKYTPVEEDARYKDGVGAGPDGVPSTYFPLRKGGKMTLYHDAHCRDGALPEIELEGRRKYQHTKCWEEICQAIVEAHHLVYIAGWSVYHKVKLIRDSQNKNLQDVANLTLGELLIRKSAEGVRVLLLAWDDKTSHHTPFFSTEGVMGVHDEETKAFFKHSSVKCVLAPRYGDTKLSWLRQRVVGTLYTHHQKLVVVDTQGRGNTRKLTSFIGGLDLTDGRFDTPEHPLFRTLNTLHRDDYHNPTFTGKEDSGGPRQPWHDLHCKIDGPAAYDVLKNFEQRWRKSARWNKDALIEISRISWIVSPNQGQELLMVTDEDDPETWHTQVFRSIDSGSVKGFPKDAREAEKQNLVFGKNVAIDKSIHTAYIERIRSAHHFIYIENQYFIGSSYAWPDYKNAGATHMIPMELALKIVSKIRSHERFAVYVLIPMWPEGVPDSVSVQEILYFQGQTMKMMYRIIADALKEEGLADKCHPRDYLNFYCLANRETKRDGEPSPLHPPAEKSPQWYAQKYRRFMIYIHSKGMIVDDEYVIIGSANINQRSMDGSRDTEIAMGAYQPHQTWARKQGRPFGQVYGYRASLWAEHLGGFEDTFIDPSDVNCVHRVNELADGYWKQYLSEETTDMSGHLMTYPIKVEADGSIGPLPGNETFPDVGGRVLGQHSLNMPDNLTG